MPKALDSGKAFVAQVLAKLPESLRAEAEKVWSAPEAADALMLVGDGVLARSDYSRSKDEMDRLAAELAEKEETLKQDYARLNEWYTPRQALVDKFPSLDAVEAEIAKRAGKPVLTPPTLEKPEKPAGMSKDEFEAALQQRDEGYAGVLAFTTTLATKHLRDFNEVLDVSDLIATARKGRKSLADAYQEKFGEKLKAKADAEEATRIDKLVADKLAEERKKQAEQPFPLRNAQPSVLDVLNQPDRKASDYGIDAATAEYERLQAARQ